LNLLLSLRYALVFPAPLRAPYPEYMAVGFGMARRTEQSQIVRVILPAKTPHRDVMHFTPRLPARYAPPLVPLPNEGPRLPQLTRRFYRAVALRQEPRAFLRLRREGHAATSSWAM
jgi:hypothetical protein